MFPGSLFAYSLLQSGFLPYGLLFVVLHVASCLYLFASSLLQSGFLLYGLLFVVLCVASCLCYAIMIPSMGVACCAALVLLNLCGCFVILPLVSIVRHNILVFSVAFFLNR